MPSATLTQEPDSRSTVSMPDVIGHLEALERIEASSDERRRRRAVRIRFEDVVHCGMSFGSEITADVIHQVVARNVSDYGLAVLQAFDVAVGTPARVRLRLLDDQLTVIHGRVRRCQQLAHGIHDVGIEFDHRVVASALRVSPA